MNGTVVAGGLMRGGGDAVRERLECSWSAVSTAAQFSPIRRSLVDIRPGQWSLDWLPGYTATAASTASTETRRCSKQASPVRSMRNGIS